MPQFVTRMLYALHFVLQRANVYKLPVARTQVSKPAAEAPRFAAPRHRSASAAHSPDSLSYTLLQCPVVHSLECQAPQIPALSHIDAAIQVQTPCSTLLSDPPRAPITTILQDGGNPKANACAHVRTGLTVMFRDNCQLRITCAAETLWALAIASISGIFIGLPCPLYLRCHAHAGRVTPALFGMN